MDDNDNKRDLAHDYATRDNTLNSRLAPYTEYLMANSGHRNLYTPQQALEARVEDQFNPATGEKDVAMVCMKCANGERGYCHNTVIHRLIAMTPKFAHYSSKPVEANKT